MRSSSRERFRKISDNKPTGNPDSKKMISVTTPRRSVTLSLRLEHCFSLSSDCLQYSTVTIQYLALVGLDARNV